MCACVQFKNVICYCEGACERVVQTPVPLNYARHTSRFLTFWCLSIPLAQVAEIGISVIPVTALVVWAMYGIQEIGLMIEEPFHRSLSLHVFCNIIHHDIQETLDHQPLRGTWESARKSEHSVSIPVASGSPALPREAPRKNQEDVVAIVEAC